MVLRIIADLIVIFIASFLAVMAINGFTQISNLLFQSYSLFILISLICIPTFYFYGIYTHGRGRSIINKFIKLSQASMISGLLLIIFFLVFNAYLKLDLNLSDLIISDMSLAWLLAFTGSIFSRIWLYTYISSKAQDESLISNNILVIGGGGYIGSSVVEQLLNKGYNVKVFDIFLFGEEPIKHLLDHPNLEINKGDFRKIDNIITAVHGCDAVIHLGGLVGDPACSVNENLTKEINLTATKIIAQIAKTAGVKKLIFASSCSVYGAQDSILTEDSAINPLSLYAKTKIASERVLNELKSKEFVPVILRFGTVYGFSGRTRFDLVVNLLTANAYTKKAMTVFGKDQTRPFVHVDDAAFSIICALEAKLSKFEDHVFNIGSNEQNCTLLELAEIIKRKVPDAQIIIEEGGDDARNYNVSFDKAKKALNFNVKWTIEKGVEQVLEKFRIGAIKDHNNPVYSNVKHLHEIGLQALTKEELQSWEESFLEESYN